MWYSAVGCLSVIFVGIFFSLLTGRRDITTLNPKLISPLVFWLKCIAPGVERIGINYVRAAKDA
ncbi:UNVERIFIED_CONTAM: hypothetical protein GTU68_022482 [Idotea baltica]|nr:hypothetical protein [Idotea baltica]